MSFKHSRVVTLSGIVALCASGNAAFGQFWCCPPPCCCPPPVCVQPCYRTVPVTELREVRQTVCKPVVETRYVDQPVTEYRRVVENKTAEIPTVSWQPVTEMHTVQRDCGRWTTQYHYRPKLHPCQYDCRPDLFGFLNRSAYSMRMAFTPDYIPERIYCPNVVTEQIPVTRQVAVRGSQTINYQVARVVPVTSTRRVAVNSVRMVSEEIVTQRPVTVFKTVPWGGTYALAPGAAGTTALNPTTSSGPTAILPRDKRVPTGKTAKLPESLNNEDDDNFRSRESKKNTDGEDRTSLKVPAAVPVIEDNRESAGDRGVAKSAERPIGRWVARKKSPPQSGPSFPQVASTAGEKSRL